MSYEIKTIYRAIVPAFEGTGPLHQGWYWNCETAERVITQDGGARQGRVHEHDAVVMGNGDVLVAFHEEAAGDEPRKTTLEKTTVYGDSDEDLRDAALKRLPDLWKKVLGLPHDEEAAAQQGFTFSKATGLHVRAKLLILDVTAEEARVLGLGDERTAAIESFEALCRKDKEESDARRRHPLVGHRFYASVPHKSGKHETSVVYTVREMVDHEATGDVELRCDVPDIGARQRVRTEDETRTWRASEIRAMRPDQQEAPT